MSQKVIVTCDVCGKVKGESNHWWGATLEKRELKYLTPTAYAFTLMKAEDMSGMGIRSDFDLCSEPCASRLQSRFMSGELVKSELLKRTLKKEASND